MITESDRGRVFEVTRAGEIVWEFYHPEVDKVARTRNSSYRVVRITNPEDYPMLEPLL